MPKQKFKTTILMEVTIEAEDLEAVSEKWKHIKKYGILKMDFVFEPTGGMEGFDPIWEVIPSSLQEGSNG